MTSPIPIASSSTQLLAPTPASFPAEYGTTKEKDEHHSEVTLRPKPPYRTRHATFFFPFYTEMKAYQPIKDQTIHEEPFITYPQLDIHSRIQDIWARTPIVLNPTALNIERPYIERFFEPATYRIALSSSQALSLLNQNLKVQRIEQGMTIVFDGEDLSRVRYIVEHCQWVNTHIAYFLVVGFRKTGDRLRFDHPRNPAFILTVPSCLADTSSIPVSALHTINPLAHSPICYGAGGDNLFSCKICVRS